MNDPLTGVEYDSNGDAWRFVCECRQWLRLGYTTRDRIERLRDDLITGRSADGRAIPKRSAEAVETLVQGMREQYRLMYGVRR